MKTRIAIVAVILALCLAGTQMARAADTAATPDHSAAEQPPEATKSEDSAAVPDNDDAEDVILEPKPADTAPAKGNNKDTEGSEE